MSRQEMNDIQRIIDHKHFQHYFCDNVDPVELLPCLNLRKAHQVEVRKLNDKRPDEANLLILERLKCEVDWKERLYRALKKAGLLESLRQHLYRRREPKAPEKRRATMETPLEHMRPLFSSLKRLDVDNRWRDLAEYAELTFDQVEMIEAQASAKKSLRSDQLIQDLIRMKGDQITLGWLLKGLKAYGHQNVFTDICKQLDVEALLEDLPDGPQNSSALGAQSNCDQALIPDLWDQLEVPPVKPPQDCLTEAMEEEGSRNGAGFDVVGREPLSPPPTASASQPSPAGRGGNMPGRFHHTRPPAGASSALPGGGLGQGATASGVDPRAGPRGRAEEGKADPYSHPHTGMENGPCPNTDMIMAEERHTSQENFHPIHLGEGVPGQTTAAAAVNGSHGMASRFEDGDPDLDSMDTDKPYEVLLRQDRHNHDGQELDVSMPVREMEHSFLHNGEQEMMNMISHQSSAYPNPTYSGQNAGSEQGGLVDASLDSGLSSTRSIDLRQPRQPQQPQRTESQDSSAGDPLGGIQLRSALERASEISAGVGDGCAASSAFVELSQQHVMNGDADGSIRMLHQQPNEIINHRMANSNCSVGMPSTSTVLVPFTSDATVVLSSSPTPPVLPISSAGGMAARICSPASLGLSNDTSTISSSNDSPTDPSVRNSPPSSLSSPSPLGSPEFGGRPEVPSLPPSCSSPEGTAREVPILGQNQLQAAPTHSASSLTPVVRSDLPNESEVFMSAAAATPSGASTGGANSAFAETSMNGPEEESHFWSLTDSISATLQSLFNSG